MVRTSWRQPTKVTTRHGEHALLLVVASAQRSLDRSSLTTMAGHLTSDQVADIVAAVPDRLPPSARPAVRSVMRQHSAAIVRALIELPTAPPGQVTRRVLGF